MKFQKKPVVIEAEQYTAYGRWVRGMCNSVSCYTAGNTEPHVHTIHDDQIVLLAVGDWIIPEPDGEHFYPVKPDIFAATYKPLRMSRADSRRAFKDAIKGATPA